MSNVTIRSASADDARAHADIYRPIVESTIVSFEEDAPDEDEFAQRIVQTSRGYPWLVAEIDGAVRGYAYAHRHRDRPGYRFSAEVSVYVSGDMRGCGIGTALYRALLVNLSERGFHRAFAGITLPNDASIALHRRFGFEPIGVFREVGRKFDRWLDVAWMQKAL